MIIQGQVSRAQASPLIDEVGEGVDEFEVKFAHCGPPNFLGVG